MKQAAAENAAEEEEGEQSAHFGLQWQNLWFAATAHLQHLQGEVGVWEAGEADEAPTVEGGRGGHELLKSSNEDI